jgi:pyrroloquinoline-quinone synthase
MSSMPNEVAVRLDRAVARKKILTHPFYLAWSAGTLTRDDLAFYSTQYWHQVQAFPGYLQTLADRLPSSSARSVVLENLADERDDDHPGLWLRWADELGVSRSDINSQAAEPETLACIESFSRVMETDTPIKGLGMLYGYESQTPEVAKTKIAGLRELYGLSDGLEYFELHSDLDIEHSRQLTEAIADSATNGSHLDEAEAGAAAGAEAIWGLLDGVSRVRAIV